MVELFVRPPCKLSHKRIVSILQHFFGIIFSLKNKDIYYMVGFHVIDAESISFCVMAWIMIVTCTKVTPSKKNNIL